MASHNGNTNQHHVAPVSLYLMIFFALMTDRVAQMVGWVG